MNKLKPIASLVNKPKLIDLPEKQKKLKDSEKKKKLLKLLHSPSVVPLKNPKKKRKRMMASFSTLKSILEAKLLNFKSLIHLRPKKC